MSSILVLDDRAIERELLVTVLGYAGHAMVEASTGGEALELARESQPDLIIVDLLMPGMNGPEFVRELRADQSVGETQVMFCTATYDDVEIRKLAQTLGVSHILVKPCEPAEILSVVHEALGNGGGATVLTVSDEFAPEQMRVLNTKLVQKVSELEAVNLEQIRLHEQLRQAERQTAESLTLLQTLQSSAPVGFGFVDRDFRIVQMNETLAAVIGLALDQQIGRTVAEIAPELWPAVEPIYRQVLETGEPVVNEELERASPSAPDDVRHLLASYYPVWLSDEVIGVGMVVIDVTELRQADDFRSVVMQNIAEGLYVTDAQGRLVFMNPAASRMTGWDEDDLRGQMVHTAIHYQHADGSPRAEQDSQLMKVLTDGQSARITDDAFVRRDGTIFRFAGSAAPLLTGATVRGSVVVFRDRTDEHAEELRVQHELDDELDELSWVGHLRDALDENRLVLFSQPIIPLTADAEPSQELLVRMLGRGGEIIPPGRFLPIAEKYGQIRELDQWVLTQAARLAATGAHLQANLSAASIGNRDLLHLVEQVLHEAGTDPANLVLEITETALMEDLRAGEAFARGITEIGCGLALDDFGTGYGSLTYLQKLPIRFLKIDIAFVRDLPTNAGNQHLVKAIVNIAQGFGQQTIAEGVEDAETLELLREYGVDLAQGFHLGRPQPIALS